jgi:predicted NAD-dependent protein-ADP-ribosyltransferase YbiA (DUF1768 family)
MKDKIDKFAGDYRWLSNFWYVDVEYEGVTYPTTEHAFQAAKTLNLGQRRHVRKAASPGEAPLIEGNTWNDRYWGVCRGTGKNRLGQILMRIRSEIRQETT